MRRALKQCGSTRLVGAPRHKTMSACCNTTAKGEVGSLAARSLVVFVVPIEHQFEEQFRISVVTDCAHGIAVTPKITRAQCDNVEPTAQQLRVRRQAGFNWSTPATISRAASSAAEV